MDSERVMAARLVDLAEVAEERFGVCAAGTQFGLDEVEI
jgi:hypothetical protein